MSEAKSKAGITKRVTPHTLRHAFATHEVAVVTKILSHLGLPTEPPELSPARGPAQRELWDHPQCSAPHTTAPAGTYRSRGPPSRAGPDFDFVEPDFDWGA